MTTDTTIADDTTTDSTVTPTGPAPKKRRPRPPRPITFDERDLNLLTMISRGIKYNDIATELDISVNTVKGILKRLYGKLGAKSGAHAVAIAIGRGMIKPEPPVISLPSAPPGAGQ